MPRGPTASAKPNVGPVTAIGAYVGQATLDDVDRESAWQNWGGCCDSMTHQIGSAPVPPGPRVVPAECHSSAENWSISRASWPLRTSGPN